MLSFRIQIARNNIILVNGIRFVSIYDPNTIDIDVLTAKGCGIIVRHKIMMIRSVNPRSRPPGVQSLDKPPNRSVTQFLYLVNTDNKNTYLRGLL